MGILKNIIAFALILIPDVSESHPFEREYTISLEELRMDGDLNLNLPLLKIAIDDSVTFNIWLDHNLEPFDYEMTRSQISIFPLSSSIAKWTKDSVVWRKPNGARKILKVQPLIRSGVAGCTTYKIGNVRAVADANGLEFEVSDDGWTLFYNKSGLYRFSTPSGTTVNVVSIGGRIKSIRTSENQILKVDETNSTQLISSESGTIAVKLNPQHSIVSVSRSAFGTVATFAYDEKGLLKNVALSGDEHGVTWITVPGPEEHGIGWTKRYALESFGEKRFGYRIQDETINLELKKPNKKSISIVTKYGNISSVSDE